MKNILPSAELIQAAKEVIMLRAIIAKTRPTVEKIHADLLAAIGAKDEEGNAVDYHTSYMMTDEYQDQFYAGLDVEYAKAGFKVEVGCCPLLIAEDNERKAVRRMNKLAEAMQAQGGVKIDSDKIYNLDHYKKLTDINLQYVAQFIK